jgi:hypothetical protein
MVSCIVIYLKKKKLRLLCFLNVGLSKVLRKVFLGKTSIRLLYFLNIDLSKVFFFKSFSVRRFLSYQVKNLLILKSKHEKKTIFLFNTENTSYV